MHHFSPCVLSFHFMNRMLILPEADDILSSDAKSLN